MRWFASLETADGLRDRVSTSSYSRLSRTYRNTAPRASPITAMLLVRRFYWFSKFPHEIHADLIAAPWSNSRSLSPSWAKCREINRRLSRRSSPLSSRLAFILCCFLLLTRIEWLAMACRGTAGTLDDSRVFVSQRSTRQASLNLLASRCRGTAPRVRIIPYHVTVARG